MEGARRAEDVKNGLKMFQKRNNEQVSTGKRDITSMPQQLCRSVQVQGDKTE